MVVTTTMSAAEYLATPEDDRHTELINGEVVVSEPRLPHGHAQTELLFRVRTWIEEAPARGYVSTPADVKMDDHNVFAPDLWWVAEDRRPAPAQLLLDGQPDLVVEIRSPSTWTRDLSVKLPAYEASGVAEAWYVDTVARTVLVFRRSTAEAATFDVTLEITAEETLTSPLLPGFALEVRTIFDR